MLYNGRYYHDIVIAVESLIANRLRSVLTALGIIFGVAAVISHELAHLWFGDLVTMRWWNGIWLNEAFATFMEMKAVEAWRPDWNVWAGFGSARAAALDVDALASTRPIEYPVVTPADAESMFDLLTYQKGAAVVRMLEQFLGEAVFRDGVRRYLSAHLGGNTDNEDLWTALEEASGEPVGDLMHAWIFRGGFPIVEGTVEGDSCTLVQSRFRYDGVEEDDRWQVPVRLRTTVGEQRVLLGDSPVVLDLDGPLVTLHAGADGFYRSEVDVSPDPGRLTAVERAMYVDDRWAGTLGGRHDPGSFAGFAEAFVDDPDLAVWQAVLRGFYTMDLVAPGRHLMPPLPGVLPRSRRRPPGRFRLPPSRWRYPTSGRDRQNTGKPFRSGPD